VKPSDPGLFPFFIDLIDSPLVNKKGNHISEQLKIMFEHEQYYRKLYSSNPLCVDNDFYLST
jgi:hypothetical protein